MKPKLLYIGLLFFVGISFPIAAAFNKPIFILGYPLLYVYLFCMWLLLTFGLWQITKSTEE